MNRQKLKQLALFGAVLVLPIAAVVIQGLQISRYRGDLAAANLLQAQDEAASAIGQTLLDELARITFAALQSISPGADGPASAAANAALDIAWIGADDGGGELQWLTPMPDGDHDQPMPTADAAAAAFGRAREAESPEAQRIYLELLQSSSDATDAAGVPWWAYAAAPLLGTMRESVEARILDRIGRDLAEPVNKWHASQLRLLLGLLSESQDPRARARLDSLAALSYERTAEYEDLGDIRALYPTLDIGTGDWLAYSGSSLWLLGMLPVSEDELRVLCAVDADSLLERAQPDAPALGIKLGLDQGSSLGDRLPQLLVEIPAESALGFAKPAPALPSFYRVTVVLAILLALFGAYFLWRDTKRESALVAMRSQFVSSVSHELKTPLTSIRMFAETLQIAEESGAGDAEKRSEYLETIVRESERLTRLLNNVLAFSQIERGQRSYHLRPTYLQDIVDEAARVMEFPLREKGIRLELAVADEVPPIRADRDAMKQAVLNLLSNALKFSGGGRQIEVRLTLENDAAVIAVADHGIGIDATEQKRIFESFYRIDNGNGQAIGGTGLGLAIVDHIARAHGGSVTVDSEPGKGSTFRIAIPVDRGPDA